MHVYNIEVHLDIIKPLILIPIQCYKPNCFN